MATDQEERSHLRPVSEEVHDAFVVDLDVHCKPSVERLLPYVDDPRIKRVLKLGGYPPSTFHWHPGYATAEGGFGLNTHGDGETGEDIRQAMDEIGVDVPILTSGLSTLAGTLNPSIKTAITRAYNDYLLNEVTTADENIRGLAMIPQWDPDAMAAEIDRVGQEDDIVGVYGFHGPYELLGLAEYDAAYERLTKYDLPLVLHGGGEMWPRYDLMGNTIRTWTEMYGFVHTAQAMMHVSNMIVSGVFEKFPDLDVVIEEAGWQWIPFFANRIDEIYKQHPEDIQLTERMFQDGESYLNRNPSEYFFDNCHFTTQPVPEVGNSQHFKNMLELCRAEDMLLYSSDWPHYTMDPPSWTFDVPLEDDVRDQILHGNAQRIFDL